MTEPPVSVGRYQIERLIAHGGMGSLYLARDPAIDRLVAIKLLKEGFDDAEARERFAREARAAGRLHHPNIVTVFDAGEHENRPFIAMEYVSGETLHQLIKQRAVGRVSEKLAILEDLCAGLHYAHGAAVVHRDIKPANVMRDESGRLKILDFGIARAGGKGITRTGDVVGTLNYMSPEQLAGEPVDHRTDVYSVGVLAYELITNQMAFPGTIQTGVLHRILNSSPVPIEGLVPGIDPDITTTIERAMARELDARHQDLDSLRQDLAVVRTRLVATASETEAAADPDAETRFESDRVASGPRPQPSFRTTSTLHRSARARAARSSTRAKLQPRHTKPIVLVGVAGAGLAIALVGTLMFDRLPIRQPPAQIDATTQQQAPPQAPAPRPSPSNAASQPGDGNPTPLVEQLSAARATARQHIVSGQRQAALDGLIRGLALDASDPELNGLVDDLARLASRTAAEARTAAARRGASPGSSAEFRGGQAREREADNLLRAGDRVPGIRGLWAAAALYNKAPEAAVRTVFAAPRSAAPGKAVVNPIEPAAAKPGGQSVSTFPGPELPKPVSASADKPAPATATPPAPTSELPPAPRDPAPDPHAADLSAIRDMLRRYTQAYESRDSRAVGNIMPTLTAEQLRALGRDFSNYRSYTAEIRDERITVDGAVATVTCQIVRSFETKNGIAGSNTAQSIFHLRRSGSGWTIERIESR